MLLAQSENFQNKQYTPEDGTAKIQGELELTCENDMVHSQIKRVIIQGCMKVKPIGSYLEESQTENINNTNVALETNYSENFRLDSVPHHTSELVIKDVMKGDRSSEESKKALQLYLGLWEAEQCERRLQNRRRKALQRAKETAQQKNLRRERDRFAKAALRAAETTEKKIKRRERDRIAKALSRMRETEEQRRARLEKNRIAMATLRASQSDREKLIRREKDRISKAKTRAVETEEQKRIRREKNRIAMAIKRAKLNGQKNNYKNKIDCGPKLL